MKFTTKDLALNAMIGALYFILVFVFQFLSFEVLQFRIAEILLILILFNPKLSFGLIISTFLANWCFSPFGIIDALVGTLASFVAIIAMLLLKKVPILTLLMPALANGVIVGYMIYNLSLGTPEQIPFLVPFSQVAFGEFVVMYLVGLPFYLFIKKRTDIQELLF